MKGYKRKKGRRILWIIGIIIVVLAAAGASVYSDINKNGKIEKISARPEEEIPMNPEKVLWQLENGIAVENWGDVTGACDYIDGRYDCADFRFQSLLRIIYVHADKVDATVMDRIKASMLSFRYWMDQPGEDSMCFWSENHQILFAASEYLAGQYYPDEVFTNDGRTGAEHMDIARERILIWLEQRWLYGFTEWYSSVYYVEDIAPLANLIEFARDDEIVSKATAIMDLLLYDVATQSYNGTFISTSGRAYERNRKSGEAGNSMKAVIQDVWGFPVDPDGRTGMDLCFIYMKNYEVPGVIRLIGRDTDTAVIKASNGLDVAELAEKGLVGQDTGQIMMQWAMEAFTNSGVIANSIKYIDEHSMFSNEFLNDFKLINITLLKKLNLLPLVSKALNPVTNGVAIQRADTYTYRTTDYLLATAQSHHPGDYGDQQHPWGATLSNEVSIFNSHPAKPLSDRGALSGSPGYWVGNGRMPHSVQDENINLSIYRIPDKKGFMEKSLVGYTHAYFPSQLLDEVVIEGKYAFGRLDGKYIAFTARNELHYAEGSGDDLIQDGRDSYWIFEISTEGAEGTFGDFIGRIKANAVSYEDDTLTYESNGKVLEVKFGGEFKVNGTTVDTDYARHDSPYAFNDREKSTMTFEFGGERLYLDFYNMARKIG
ncbi:MAG: hypothetical protein JXB33_01170 [Clostridia bacterium]|nr:hypothetical protein [Clostridia bacterium]